MAQTAGGTYYAASSELVSSWPATSLDLANQLESRFAAKLTTPGAWTSYTPALTASTTNPTLGTGATAAGYYTQVGKLVVGKFAFVMGSTFSGGSGTYRVSRPVTGNANGSRSEGSVFLYDASGNLVTAGILNGNASNSFFELYYTGATAGAYFATATTPWTWAVSDIINGSFWYEAA